MRWHRLKPYAYTETLCDVVFTAMHHKPPGVRLKCPRCGNPEFDSFHVLSEHYTKCDGIDYQTIKSFKHYHDIERNLGLIRVGLHPTPDGGWEGTRQAYARARSKGLL